MTNQSAITNLYGTVLEPPLQYAKIFRVHGQSANMRKNDLPANYSFNKVKELNDTMALEGSPLAEEHALSYMFCDLSSDYPHVVIDSKQVGVAW